MDNEATNLMDREKPIRYHQPRMSRRVKALLAEIEAWCDQERGRKTELANYFGLPLSTVSAWFREYRKPRPAKQPTAEQILGIQEFLAHMRQTPRERSATEPLVLETATVKEPSESDALLDQLARWCYAGRGRRLVLAAHEIDVPPELVADWFARRKSPTWEQGLRIQKFLDQHREK